MTRLFNFNPGPAALPQSVLEKAQNAILEVDGWGAGIMEVSHRSPQFENMLAEMQVKMRRIMNIPDDYHILFCQGGARMQFAMIPMNFLHTSAAYVDTGTWSDKGIEASELIGETRVVASSKEQNYNHIPAADPSWLQGDESYFHITSNNTIYGTQWHNFPDTGDVPFVIDMSSDIASDVVDFSQFDMIYAGAQKNIGAAGVTLVLIKDEFAQKAKADHLPPMLRYSTFIESNSLYNTPPVWNIFIVKLMIDWLEEAGGLEAIGKRNREKAAALYSVIDESPTFFKGHATEDSRSIMNITFNLPSVELEKKLVADATAAGFMGIKGHRSVGGIRVSNYNAVTVEAVAQLTAFLKDFAKRNG
ncbi:MAG: 3-phosphoserine/phosphohydroxythreonine transaminase [Deltaproteobacteria bacterium]|nr:MAG: 3-phosphoserine/phosphohydroxythreonine transaminase [Deltaproteobacteria bacterium]